VENLKSSAHAVYVINYHFVWGPKGNQAIRELIMLNSLADILVDIAAKYELDIIEKKIEPGYIHLFVSARPRWSPSLLIQKLKGISSTQLYKRYPELRVTYPGGIWSRGYYIGTSGDVPTQELIQEIIRGVDHNPVE